MYVFLTECPFVTSTAYVVMLMKHDCIVYGCHDFEFNFQIYYVSSCENVDMNLQ